MNINFSGPEAGVNPRDHNPFESESTLEPDFDFEASNDDGEEVGVKIGRLEILLNERNNLLKKGDIEGASAINDELKEQVEVERNKSEKDRDFNTKFDVSAAEQYNKLCREFDEEHNRKAA